MKLRVLAPGLSLALCLAPLAAGLLVLVLPAFGYHPALGYSEFGLSAWRELLRHPGLWESIALSVQIGVGSTLLALVIALAVLSLLWRTRAWRAVTYLLAPALALPHVAFAIGFAFLIAPSGWLARALAPVLGWSAPPGWLTVNDPYGLSLMIMLVIKEVPFILLMAIAVLGQLRPDAQLLMARSLGYDPVQAWWKVLIPQLYRKLRLVLFSVLIYGLTVVDVALIIGPLQPATFAVQVYHWFYDPALEKQLVASSGALLLLAVCVLVLLAWGGVERLLTPLAHRVWLNGRQRVHHPWLWAAALAIPVFALLSLLTQVALGIWSLARRWRFPDLWPSRWSGANWQRNLEWLADPLWQSLLLALVSSLVALALVVVLLEYQHRRGRYWPLFLPCIGLLVPQLSLFVGLQVLLGDLLIEQAWLMVCWGHLLMVFPYISLRLHGAYRAFDGRYQLAGLALGRSNTRVFWAVKWPLLWPAILSAWAVGFGVSVVQYLPTLLLGGGRLLTITTEAVAIGSGYDRRLAAVYGLSQALLPLLAYLLARAWGKPRAWH